jgi:phosphate transport system substrate-binding protein
VVESTGTGGGFKLFCSGLGLDTPDMVMASRRMKPSEAERCRDNGVSEVVELKIGYDGIVVANAKGAPHFDLTTRDLYLALAMEVPDPAGRLELVANPYRRWSQIDPRLPDLPIRVYGPPPTSGTRDILVERLLARACAEVGFLRSLQEQDEESYRHRCHALREDGAYVNAGENDARLVRRLIDDPGALGVLGYNFVDRNADRLQASLIDGVAPEFELIESGEYPMSRPLLLYVKRAHTTAVPGLQAFAQTMMSPEAAGNEGYLLDSGLIPLQEGERQRWSRSADLGEAACRFPDCP